MTGGHDESLHFIENAGTYERWDQIEVEDFRLYGQTAYKSVERLDSSASLEINSFEKNYDYNRDVHFIQTTEGWQIRFEQLGVNPMFCISVDENSEICKMSLAVQKADDSKNSTACIWGDAENGYRELLNDEGTKLYINYDCNLLVTD